MMANPSGAKPGDPFTSEHFLRGWCPDCGRRRVADARCKNCDVWWTSPLIQAGVPVLLGVFFVLTTASTLFRQTQKPVTVSVAHSGAAARLVTVTVERSRQETPPRTASVAAEVPETILSPSGLSPETARIQREGAYINAMLRAQDDAFRSQQIRARNQEMAAALQQRMQSFSAAQNQSGAAPLLSTSQRRIEQLVTEDTIVVPL